MIPENDFVHVPGSLSERQIVSRKPFKRKYFQLLINQIHRSNPINA
jgi:hypothetical protein